MSNGEASFSADRASLFGMVIILVIIFVVKPSGSKRARKCMFLRGFTKR